MRQVFLTGIKPTGNRGLHLGNYVGSIHTITEFIKSNKNCDIYIFIADGHSLTAHPDSKELRNNIKDLMISYCAIFDKLHNTMIKNNNSIYFYRQSKIPPIFELNWILSCYTAKGLLNRNHTYKQETEKNIQKGKDPDKSIFAGIFNYPILMAADILIMDADYIPVGKDQLQHIEITNDIASKINYVYNESVLKPVIPLTNQENYVLPGKDGNKMSKSYGNEVPLFASEDEIKKYIYGIKTNSKGEGDPKYPEESELSSLYKAFATEYQYDNFVKFMNDGAHWKTLKDFTFAKINDEIREYRINYNAYTKKIDMIRNRFEMHEKYVNTRARLKLNDIKNIIGI